MEKRLANRRNFYFKLLHRIVVTKKELFIYGIEDNTLCSYCGQNDSIIHTFSKCHWTQLFFLEVIKWFIVENVTSFSLSPSELIFGIKTGSKKQNTFKINKKLNFTILFAKYYLYTQKLSLKELSLNEFIVKLTWRYDLEKPHF